MWATEFKDKRVVITGAAGTLGGWLIREFVAAGALVGAADRNAAALEELDRRHGLAQAGGFVQATELLDDDSIAALVARVRAVWGAPDIVVNAAGIFPTGALLETGNDDWDRILDIDLRAPFILTRDLARLMIEQGVRGSIVNVTSGAARVLRPGLVPYCVAKTGLERLTKGFALELGAHGIRVNAVEPGFMPGPGVPDEAVARASAAIPLGRVSGPQDAPNAILFLCSGLSSFTTGATLNTDGGYTLTAAAIDPSANANNPHKLRPPAPEPERQGGTARA